MRNIDEIFATVADQVRHWYRIGKIESMARETVEEAAEYVLSPDELDLAYDNRVIRDVLMSI